MRSINRRIIFTGMVLVLVLGLGTASAAQKTVIDLPTALKKALALSPEVLEGRAQLLFAEAREREAKGYRWPQIQFNFLFGPVPDAEGDHIFSPDERSQIWPLGPFGRADALATQPLVTFGRFAAIDAARHGVEVDTAGLELKSAEVGLKVVEYYSGLRLAIALKELLDEAVEMVGESLAKTEKLLELENSTVTEMDLYRLQSAQGMAEGLLAEANMGVALAQRALAAITGHDGPPLFPKEKYLKPVKARLKGLGSYQDSARAARPELRQLEAGLKAMDKLVEAAEAEKMPIIYLAGYFSAAYAPNRTDITNPFIDDEFNHVEGGVALGAMWNLDFGITRGKIDQAKAEKLKLKAKEAFAEMYLPVEVTQAYLEVKANKEKIAAAKKAYRSARRWFLAASSNFDLGLIESKEVSDSLVAYATQRAAYLTAVHGYNLSWAKLKKAAGLEQ